MSSLFVQKDPSGLKNLMGWNDQDLKESRSYRMARAVKHAESTLKAGFIIVRDLGKEPILLKLMLITVGY